jgi:DNA polymerase
MGMKDLWVVDLETFYSKTYSLSKMSTAEYILGAEFEVIGLSIAKNDEPAVWYSFEDQDKYADVLAPLHGQLVVAHNAMFDIAILDWVFGVRPGVILDTLSMSRPLHGLTVGGSLSALAKKYGIGEKGTEVVNALGKHRKDFTPAELAAYGEYCKNDTELTRTLFHRLKKYTSATELKVVDRTIRMFTEPKLLLDRDMLRSALEEERERKAKLLREAVVDRKAVMSNNMFADLLQGHGVHIPKKISPTTGKETWPFAKTDEFMVELQEHENPAVQALAAARLGNKSTLNETRMEKLIDLSFYGPLAVPVNYCGAVTTWRASGAGGLNFQNFPRGGAIRMAITAPAGHSLVVADSSNIELRTNHTLARQLETIASLKAGRDLYREFASVLYNKPEDEITKDERFDGKVAHLGLGYGMGWQKFQDTCRRFGKPIDDDVAQRIVTTYRDTYDAIPRLWRDADRLLNAMADGIYYELHTAPFVKSRKGVLLTPPQHHIQYPRLTRTADGFEYQSRRGRGTETVRIYGPKIVENLCIAAGTLVLTDSGWVAIENVTDKHRVFDGVEFVNHGGLIFKGRKHCVTLDGVNMTADHEVLTNVGWKQASLVQGPDGPNLRYVDRDSAFAEQWQNLGVGVRLPMWEGCGAAWQGRDGGTAKGRDSELRLPHEDAHVETENARHEQTSGLCRLAQYVRQVSAAVAPSVGKLRWAWDQGMQAVGGFVRELLGGHGAGVQAWAHAGPQEQPRALPQAELPMGGLQDPEQQPAGLFARGPSARARAYGGPQIDATETLAPQDVYDITNAGPRARFVVAGASGPFLAHNCQHISRNILMEQLVTISRRYPVALMVHDEFVLVVPDEEAEEALAWTVEVMSTSPEWWPEIPLAAEGSIAKSYGAAK